MVDQDQAAAGGAERLDRVAQGAQGPRLAQVPDQVERDAQGRRRDALREVKEGRRGMLGLLHDARALEQPAVDAARRRPQEQVAARVHGRGAHQVQRMGLFLGHDGHAGVARLDQGAEALAVAARGGVLGGRAAA